MPIFTTRLIELNMTSDPTGALSGTTLSNSGGDFLGAVDAAMDSEAVGNINRMNPGDLVDLDGDGTFEGTYEGRFRFFGGSTWTYGDGSTATVNIHIAEISVGGTSRYFLMVRDGIAGDIDANNLQSVTLGPNFSTHRNVNAGAYDDADSFVLVCFAEGTRIRAEYGDVPIEALEVGNRVWTRDRGMRPIRWIGKRTVDATGEHAPIRFEKGVIGNYRTLYVSPSHKMFLDHPLAELYFGEKEVLVPAKGLVNDRTITEAPCKHMTYYHLLFDDHELVEANGCLAESFYPTHRNIVGQDEKAVAELARILPDIYANNAFFGEMVLPTLNGREARLISKLVASTIVR